ncbi:MAG: hypothetical protein ACYC1I_06745 [Acidimicrobiales bacterium]
MKGVPSSLELDDLRSVGQTSMRQQHFQRLIRHPDFATLTLGLIIGLAVCAPLFSSGRVYLLDWSIGPRVAATTPAALGLNGGLTTGAGAFFAVVFLNWLLGSAVTWLPIFVFFPIATVGTGRLAGRSLWSRLAAGTLYAVNPFVFNRIFVGHVPLLIGYALLPFAVAAARRSISTSVPRWTIPALWWVVLTVLSPHFAWIFGVVIFAIVIAAFSARQHPLRRIACWFAVVAGEFALMSAYIYLPHLVTNLPTRVGSTSLQLYQTSSDPHLGLFTNVLGLYGFWRVGPGPELPKEIITGWPFLLIGILLVVGYGAWGVVRKSVPRVTRLANEGVAKDAQFESQGAEHDAELVSENSSDCESLDRRQLGLILVVVGVMGYFLALGNQGPTAGLFLWAYEHAPFFSVMREPEKFVMLLALAYSVFFGWGVERLSQMNFSSSKYATFAVATTLGVALPLGYTPTIFNGLAGQIAPSTLPSAYQRADSLMGQGAGNILYVPWHLYMAYSFTNNRVVANVGATSFSRNVISADNVESGGVATQSTSPRSAYLQQLFANGTDLKEFGALVAPLGVKYVVLAKTVDWRSYNWLNAQSDLRLVFNSDSLEVWKNSAYYGVGTRTSKLKEVSSFAELLALAKSHELGTAVVLRTGAAIPTLSRGNEPKSSVPLGTLARRPAVQILSPVAYRVHPGPPGWISVDAPFQRGWTLNGRKATSSAEGTILVHTDGRGGVLVFNPWRMARLGYEISIGVFLALLAVLIFGAPGRMAALRRLRIGSVRRTSN